MGACRHAVISPIWVNGEVSNGYQPGICGTCGTLVDIRTGRPMNAGQAETWLIEQIEQRVRAVRTAIFVSEVNQ